MFEELYLLSGWKENLHLGIFVKEELFHAETQSRKDSIESFYLNVLKRSY